MQAALPKGLGLCRWTALGQGPGVVSLHKLLNAHSDSEECAFLVLGIQKGEFTLLRMSRSAEELKEWHSLKVRDLCWAK